MTLPSFSRIPNVITALSRVRPDPGRDWLILLVTACVAFLFIVGWHVWAFETVISGKTLGETESSAQTTATSSPLDTIHAVVEARAVMDAKYRDGTYRFADPSQ